MGIRLAVDKQAEYARELVTRLAGAIGANLVEGILGADQSSEKGINEQRERVVALRQILRNADSREARDLLALADTLVKKSVWILGGDGWAYDIGYGGLDHVVASGQNVNILVLDTEVYSNTGGQMSKATPRGAVAKFAAGGKRAPKKDLGMMAVNYGSVYVARVAMGGNDQHTVKAFIEAESWHGPSLIIAYSHCIAHGYDLVYGLEQQKNAVLSAYWPLFRYDPRRAAEGKNPFQLDSRPATLPLDQYIYKETRYNMLVHSSPEIAKELLKEAEQDVRERWKMYEQFAAAVPAGAAGAVKTAADAKVGATKEGK
jgi:pyruvate-ferredoxin/flavodoxin oxidoreductase